MKKEYETPRAEKLEFDFCEVVAASKDACIIAGSAVTWNDSGDYCSNSAPGND